MIIASQNKKSLTSKEKLTDALFSLLEKDSFSDITVLQITQYANVSRAAYYRNFETKEDIIRYSVIKKINEFMEHIEQDSQNILFDEMAFINLWVKEKKYFQLLHRNGLINIFIAEHQNYVSKYVKKIMGKQNSYYDYLASCMTYGTIAILDVWLQHDCKESEKELVIIIKKLRESMTLKSLI